MILGDVLVRDETGFTLAQIAPGPDGWKWTCRSEHADPVSSQAFLSASAALADFESHVERRHP